ncbi:MAG: hypothetical protein ACFFCO_03060 [Promethearchaeota archaeon]
MSEFLLLSVYTRYLETQGYQVQRRVSLGEGAGQADIKATKDKETILVEARWVKEEGDILEALARCVMNKQALPKAAQVLVLDKSVGIEKIGSAILDRCWEHGIKIHIVDINLRQVFEDTLTCHVFPGIQSLLKKAKSLLKKGSDSDRKVLNDILGALKDISGPPTLVADIKALLE